MAAPFVYFIVSSIVQPKVGKMNFSLYQLVEAAKSKFRTGATRLLTHAEAIAALNGKDTESDILSGPPPLLPPSAARTDGTSPSRLAVSHRALQGRDQAEREGLECPRPIRGLQRLLLPGAHCPQCPPTGLQSPSTSSRAEAAAVLPCCAALLCCPAVLPCCAALLCCLAVLPCCAALLSCRCPQCSI